MIACQTAWPRHWLMTDERMGERLWDAIDKLPIGDGGVIFRHYSLSAPDRAALAARVATISARRGILFGVAKDSDLAAQLGAALIHKPPEERPDRPFSLPVHSLDEAKRARSRGASLVFVSPLHETRSHPAAKPLGRELAKKIVRAVGCPAIALGGMDARKFAAAERIGFYGWAAIDAWIQ